MIQLHPIDFISKKYNVSKYYISKVGNVTQSALSKAIERDQATDSLTVKTIIAISKAIQKTPGETLDELLNYEEEFRMNNVNIKGIKKAVGDFNKWQGAARIYFDKENLSVETYVYSSGGNFEEFNDNNIVEVAQKATHSILERDDKITMAELQTLCQNEL